MAQLILRFCLKFVEIGDLSEDSIFDPKIMLVFINFDQIIKIGDYLLPLVVNLSLKPLGIAYYQLLFLILVLELLFEMVDSGCLLSILDLVARIFKYLL